jgi:hypothetical protein
MLDKPQTQPQQVTRPIQLLAAWLVGLIVIDGIFLEIALRLDPGSWERGWLVLAAILNVPAFLTAMFTLQTRFRAELQDDPHYAQYLSKKTAQSLTVVRVDEARATPFAALPPLLSDEIVDEADLDAEDDDLTFDDLDADDERDVEAATANGAPLDWSPWRIAINDHLPQFSSLRDALHAAGIPVAEVFGHAQRAGTAPPANQVVAINRALPVAHKAALLRVLLPFGLDGFQLWRPVVDADENEDVYIGSYGVAHYARFTGELATLLEDDVADADLDDYRRRHLVREEERAAEAS